MLFKCFGKIYYDLFFFSVSLSFFLCNTLQLFENMVFFASSGFWLSSSLPIHSQPRRLSSLFLFLSLSFSLCLCLDIQISWFFSWSISISLCWHATQEYIRRQLEEEQRQLEILQQQLLQEQALLLVTIALPRAATAIHLCLCGLPIPIAWTRVSVLQNSLWGNPQSEPPNQLAIYLRKSLKLKQWIAQLLMLCWIHSDHWLHVQWN